MESQNNSEELLTKIFERAEDPLTQLERINNVYPGFFADDDNVEYANKELSSYGYQINQEYTDEVKRVLEMYGHSACGSSNNYGGGHSACGTSNNYGYGGGHPTCGSSNNHRRGHSACCGPVESGKSLLLIPTTEIGSQNEIRN